MRAFYFAALLLWTALAAAAEPAGGPRFMPAPSRMGHDGGATALALALLFDVGGIPVLGQEQLSDEDLSVPTEFQMAPVGGGLVAKANVIKDEERRLRTSFVQIDARTQIPSMFVEVSHGYGYKLVNLPQGAIVPINGRLRRLYEVTESGVRFEPVSDEKSGDPPCRACYIARSVARRRSSAVGCGCARSRRTPRRGRVRPPWCR